MVTSRQGYDLFNRHCWRLLRRPIYWPDFRRYVFRDTFTRFICWLSGGHEFTWQPDVVNEPEEIFCHWCHKRKPKEE